MNPGSPFEIISAWVWSAGTELALTAFPLHAQYRSHHQTDGGARCTDSVTPATLHSKVCEMQCTRPQHRSHKCFVLTAWPKQGAYT